MQQNLSPSTATVAVSLPEGVEWSPRPDHEREARRARYRAREVLWRESSLARVRKCGRVARADVVPVVVGDGVAHFANLARCASIHACPVCSPRIRQARAGEIAAGVSAWLASGGTALFITGTLPHDGSDRLADLYTAVASGTGAMWSGKAWQDDRARHGIVGVIRALEVTHGESGWHPHVHALLLLDGEVSEDQADELVARLRARWGRGIVRAGYRPPDEAHGFTAVRVFDAYGIAAYTAKLDGDVSNVGVSLELARHDLKAGRRANRTPWELLIDVERWGDAADLRLWGEYERASRGRRAIVWSRGLKDRLDVATASDEEIVAVEVPGLVVAVLDRAAWRLVSRIRSAAALILDLAELDGAEGVALGLRELAKARAPV